MTKSEAGKLGKIKTAKIQEEQYKERIKTYEANPKKCRFCLEDISYNKRKNDFCNQSCGASFNNEKRGIIKSCLKCNINFVDSRSNFCKNHRSHSNTKLTDIKEAKTDHTRKRILLEIKEYKCEVCNLSTWCNKKIPLELDHIDGNSDNNDMSNLRLICCNCHAQTETYKGKNKFKGSSRQVNRRERYKTGKTY